MGLMSSLENAFTGGAQGDVSKYWDQAKGYYNQAQGYMNPFYQGGMNAFNQWNSNSGDMNKMLGQYGNPADFQWRMAGQDPSQYYQHIMSNYTESPEAKYAQEQAMRAGNASAAASGMMGSGAYQKGIQSNANDISQRDRGQYFNNIMGVNQQQMSAIQNYQQQQAQLRQMLAQQAGMGYGAAGQMSGNAMNMSSNAMNEGQQQANWDNQGFNNMVDVAGMAARTAMGW